MNYETNIPALEIIHHIPTIRDFGRTIQPNVSMVTEVHKLLEEKKKGNKYL